MSCMKSHIGAPELTPRAEVRYGTLIKDETDIDVERRARHRGLRRLSNYRPKA